MLWRQGCSWGKPTQSSGHGNWSLHLDTVSAMFEDTAEPFKLDKQCRIIARNAAHINR